jgi:uncharacterized protein YacL
MVLKRIEPLSLAKVAVVLYGGLGLIIGLLVSVVATLGFAFAPGGENAPPAILAPLFGIGAIVFFPLLYGFFGGLAALLGATLYNLAARLTGGIRLTLE